MNNTAPPPVLKLSSGDLATPGDVCPFVSANGDIFIAKRDGPSPPPPFVKADTLSHKDVRGRVWTIFASDGGRVYYINRAVRALLDDWESGC